MQWTLRPLAKYCDLHWQVLNEGQAFKLAQLTGKHRGVAAALCAEVAGARPARSAPQGPCRAVASSMLSMADIAYPQVLGDHPCCLPCIALNFMMTVFAQW